MKKSLICLVGLILCFSCISEEEETFDVMTWNIWHGGLHGDATSNFEKDSLNALNVFKVLKENNPDILFMQETYCCGMEMAHKAGYKHSWRASSNLSIHSKFPIIDTIHLFRPFNSQAVVIDINDTKVLCVNLWLNYLPDYFPSFDKIEVDSMILGEKETRLKEIKAIVKSVDSLEKVLNMPVIIGGDFNSSSHLDWIAATKSSHFGKVVEWPVTKFMETSGYKDSFREIHANPIETLQGTWGFLGNEGSVLSDRIDYIYYKGTSLKPLNSRIVSEDPRDGFFNSDHRAIQTKFVLK